MQATSEQKETNQWLSTAVTTIIIVIAIILFGAAISQLGLLKGVLGRETAVSSKLSAGVPDDAITLTAQSMRFGLTELQVTAGEETTLVLDNHDLYGHSFDNDDLDLHAEMAANGRSVITFIATEPGTYEIYCGVPGHREAGMVSTLVVTP